MPGAARTSQRPAPAQETAAICRQPVEINSGVRSDDGLHRSAGSAGLNG
jgi:hypothetical protein